MIDILLIDDHPIVRDGLSAVLESRENIKVVGVAGSANEGAKQALSLDPDIIIADLEMPDSHGVDSVHTIMQACPQAKIIVFTAYDIEEIVLEALHHGASGYILKGAPSDEIFTAIQTVIRGEVYLSPRIALTVVNRIRGKSFGITKREKEVLRLIAAGLSNKQVAHTLNISEATVKFHVTSILNKLGASNRAQAVNIAMANKIV